MVLVTFRQSRCIQPEWALWCPLLRGITPVYVVTGCHLAVSLPLPKCERCVKRGQGTALLFGKPYRYWALRGLWLV